MRQPRDMRAAAGNWIPASGSLQVERRFPHVVSCCRGRMAWIRGSYVMVGLAVGDNRGPSYAMDAPLFLNPSPLGRNRA